ncbi:MAG: FMN-binding protein [Actinobacteria bacterium]|nr:FMN-binding protein [Actinomycetota bacterium]
MRRSLPILLATVLGLGLLASFHTTPSQTVLSTPAPVSPAPPTTAGNPPAGAPPNGGDGSGLPSRPSPSSTAPSFPTPSPTTTTTAPVTETRVVDGPVEVNRYGPVQVRVTLSSGRIVDVLAVELPTDRNRSAQISQFAGPVLRQEALQAQSAQIHTVSGATYTSTGYRQSLQAALDQAGHP